MLFARSRIHFSNFRLLIANNAQGAKYGYVWAGSNLACFVFFYLFVPETKGRTLEEIDELFNNRVPVQKFKTYQTTIIDDAVNDVKDQCGKSEKTVDSTIDQVDAES